MSEQTRRQAKVIRVFRWAHRKLAILLFVFFAIISLTGILLGLKKNTGLLAPTTTGVSSQLATWLPLDSLEALAKAYLHDTVSGNLNDAIDRLDIRPDKGIVKFLFKDHYWGLQLDGTNGKLLLVERRSSDFIEDLHDGSILDNVFGTSDEQVKVGYTVLMGISLFMLVATGFWLWYGPKRLRKRKRAEHG